jgi:hypothetical protein
MVRGTRFLGRRPPSSNLRFYWFHNRRCRRSSAVLTLAKNRDVLRALMAAAAGGNKPSIRCDRTSDIRRSHAKITPTPARLDRLRRFYLLPFPLLICGASAHGDTTQETIKGYYHHTAWTQKDGAPPVIWAITQTRNGWLWLGSHSGLTRFEE